MTDTVTFELDGEPVTAGFHRHDGAVVADAEVRLVPKPVRR